MVIVRPRGGNFEFLEEEIEIMKDDIRIAKELGAYGVVIGALKGNKIDIDATKAFVEEAKPLSTTFHMAFDEIDDKFQAIDQLAALGIDRILTKGGTALFEAMKAAREERFEEAEELVKKADASLLKAQESHMGLIQQEAEGKTVTVSLLLMHAEDQMMTTETLKGIVREVILTHKKYSNK